MNGPVARAIDLNCGYNHTGSRWRATSTIGRALQLAMMNIGGTPGSINIHTQGHIARFRDVIAENEDENPWEPLHVERGHAADASVVTVIPACTAAMIDDNGGSQTAKDLLNTISRSIAYVGNRNINGKGQPLLILAPQHARLIALGGYSKADVKRFIWEHARVPFGDIPRGNLVNYSEHNLKFYADAGDACGVPIAEEAGGHRDRRDGRRRHAQPFHPDAPCIRERDRDDSPQGRIALEALERLTRLPPPVYECRGAFRRGHFVIDSW